MFARVFDGVWKENVEASQRVWQRLTQRQSRQRSWRDPDPVPVSRTERARNQPRGHRKVIGGVAAAIGVLALTYSAASALVNGAAGSSSARSDYATVMQAASAEYRRARAECLALPYERRDGCIAEAHANEGRLRTAATSAPRKQLLQLRQQSDWMLLAAQGLDNIVIEPACNVVARGSASVCEIQVKGSTVEGPEALAMLRQTSAVSDQGDERRAVAQWVGGGREHYFANVATVAP